MAKMNRNQALSNSYRLIIPGLEEFNYFIQNAELPGVSMMGVDTPYQQFGLSAPSNRIEYETMNVGFLVDEDYKNYEQILRWMEGIRDTEPVMDTIRDVTLHILSSNKAGIAGIKLIGAYPVMLSSIPLDTGVVDATPIVCSMTLRYQIFQFVR